MAAPQPATDPPQQESPRPAQPAAPASTPPTADPSPPVWPRSAQVAAATLVAVCLLLIAWRWYGDHRGTRPGELVRPAPAAAAAPIDLNRAGRPELLQLPGVGPTLADHILAYREANGPFASVEDLRAVHGIGDTTLLRIKPWLHVDGVSTPAQAGEEPVEEPVRLTRKSPAPAAGSDPAGKKPAPAEPVDVNRATVEELQTLPGVGPALARRIVAEREKQRFARVDDLRRVRGIGAKTLEKLRPFVKAGG